MHSLLEYLDPRALATLPQPLILLIIAFGTYLSEDLACVAAGVLVSQQRLGFAPATTACLAGIYSGDVMLFVAGRFLGTRPLRALEQRWASKVQRGREWIATRGLEVVFITRVLPGLRVPIYVAAGALHTNIRRFSMYFLAAAIIWTPLLVGSVVLLGARLSMLQTIGIAVALIVTARLIAKFFEPPSAQRNRSAADAGSVVGE